MATSYPPFASTEYVKRWLSDVESKPTADLQAETRPSRSSETKHAPKPYQSPETELARSLQKRRKRIADETSRSHIRKKPHSTEDEMGSDEEGQDCSSSSAFDHPVGSIVKNYISVNSAPQQAAPKDRSQKYARRARYKTKPDRYEYKGDAVKEITIEKTSKQKSKRSRRRKTGDALNHEFKAPNVEQERLTLKTNPGPGIFGKGKASALLQTRGLPDLTFSEMNFLSKKRISDQGETDKQRQRKPAKKKDKLKEISEFFAKTSSEVVRRRLASSEVPRRQYSMGYTDAGVFTAISSPAELASGTELGVASNNMSAPRRVTDAIKQVHMSNGHKKVRHGPRSVRSDALAADMASKPVEAATSHYSWSVTPSQSDSRHRTIPTPPDVTIEQPRSAQKPDFSPSPGSSVTNSSLDRYAKQLLLDRDQNSRRQSHRAGLSANFYSLDDLKGLAQLAQIEERYRGLPETVPRSLRSVESQLGPAAPCVYAPYGDRPEPTERNHLATIQPDMDNFTERPAGRTLSVTPGVFQPSQLHSGNGQQNEGPPGRSARDTPVSLRREIVAMRQCSTRAKLSTRHNRPGYIQFGHDQMYPLDGQDFYHTKQHQPLVTAHLGRVPELDIGAFEGGHDEYVDSGKPYFYEDTVQETFDLGSDENVPNAMEMDEIPELPGLQYGEEMEEQFVGCKGAEIGQVMEYNGSHEGLGMYVDDTIHVSGQRNVSGHGRERLSMWDGRSTVIPEEEFLGLSRPQILY